MPYTQLMGDANPSGSKHHLVQRSAAGRLTWLHSTHKDNPTLYDINGVLTEYGVRVMADLSSLTGIRRKRLYEGIWATAEGAVYDNFDHAVHVKERDIKDFQRWGLAMDEGYTNPAVILLIGIDSDGRWHVYQEWYERGKLQEAVIAQARKWVTEYKCSTCAVDSSAAGLIADLRNNGIPARQAKGRVLDGIQAIQNRLKVAGDKLPRLTIDPSCVNTINEFESYIWKPEKDEPVKENDHAMDSLRYFEDAGLVAAEELVSWV
jgi:phage terminase large subunit